MTTTAKESTRQDGAVRKDWPQRQAARIRPTFMTTEFAVYVVAVLGVLIASMVVDGNGSGDNGGAGDYFRADRAWLYVVVLTVGYMISRGLAKIGNRNRNRDNYNS